MSDITLIQNYINGEFTPTDDYFYSDNQGSSLYKLTSYLYLYKLYFFVGNFSNTSGRMSVYLRLQNRKSGQFGLIRVFGKYESLTGF